jgi:hypothetical protein
MGQSSPKPVKTSRTGAWSRLRSFSLHVSAAPTGVPLTTTSRGTTIVPATTAIRGISAEAFPVGD